MIILILLFTVSSFAQVTSSRVNGDTVFVKVVGFSSEIPLIIGKKNVDTLFLSPARFKDNVEMDSSLILKKGLKDYNTETLIDSFKTSDNFDYLRFYLTTPNDSENYTSYISLYLGTVGHQEFTIMNPDENILGFALTGDEIIDASIDNFIIQIEERDIGAIERQ